MLPAVASHHNTVAADWAAVPPRRRRTTSIRTLGSRMSRHLSPCDRLPYPVVGRGRSRYSSRPISVALTEFFPVIVTVNCFLTLLTIDRSRNFAHNRNYYGITYEAGFRSVFLAQDHCRCQASANSVVAAMPTSKLRQQRTQRPPLPAMPYSRQTTATAGTTRTIQHPFYLGRTHRPSPLVIIMI